MLIINKVHLSVTDLVDQESYCTPTGRGHGGGAHDSNTNAAGVPLTTFTMLRDNEGCGVFYGAGYDFGMGFG